MLALIATPKETRRTIITRRLVIMSPVDGFHAASVVRSNWQGTPVQNMDTAVQINDLRFLICET